MFSTSIFRTKSSRPLGPILALTKSAKPFNGNCYYYQEFTLRHYFLTIVIVLFMVATPLLAAVSPALSCDDQKCCHPTDTMQSHHGMADERDKACQCHRAPLRPCHIATDPHPPQPAITVSNDRGPFQNMPTMAASVETDPDGSLPETFTRVFRGLRPDHHPPPLYLLACTLII